MLKSLDRIKELTSTTGTGTLTLTGAESGFQAFSVLGNGTKCYYTITDVNTTDFEVGEGTYNSNTLTRDTIFESSNSGNAISLSATGSTVFVTYPAEKSAFRDIGVNRDYTASGSITAGKPLILNADNTVSQVAQTTSSDVAISNTTGAGIVDSNNSEKQAFNFYCSAQNTFVAGYLMPNGYPTIVAYTVATDGSVTSGTPVALKSIGSYTIDGILTSGSTVVFTYGDNSGDPTYGYIRAGTLSGTTFTLGTELEVSSASNYYNYMYCSLGYDSNADAGLVTYSYNSTGTIASASIKSKVFTLSGTTITLGSETAIDTTTGKFGNLTWGYYGVGNCLKTVFDPDNNLIVSIRSYPTGQGTESVDAYVGTITGGSTRSVSWGAKQTIKANTAGSDGTSQPKYVKQIGAIYDTINNRLLIGNVDDNSSNLVANWKTDISNCTINSNSTITVNSSTEVATFRNYPSFAFINENNSYLFVLTANEYYDNSAYDVFYKVVPSSTAVTVSTLHTSNFGSKYTGGIAYNSTDKTTGYLTYWYANSTDFTYDLVVRSGGFSTNVNLTNDNYFGIASTTASTTEPVGVNRAGSFNNDQTGMTAGKDMYVTDTGLIKERTTTTTTTNTTLTNTSQTITDPNYSPNAPDISYDSVSDRYIKTYRGASDYPEYRIGTYNSSTKAVDWGTALVIASYSTRGYNVFNSVGNSGVIGITWTLINGSTDYVKFLTSTIDTSDDTLNNTGSNVNVVSSSSEEYYPQGVVWDSGSSRFIVTWTTVQSSPAYTIYANCFEVGSDPNGDPVWSSSNQVTVDNTNGNDYGTRNCFSLIYDPDTQRTVHFFLTRDGSNNVRFGGRVLSISGSTITVGAKTTSTVAPNNSQDNAIITTYDTQNNKIICAFQENITTYNKIYYQFVTVTGSSTNTISFNTGSQLTTFATDKYNIAFDTDNNKAVLLTQNRDDSYNVYHNIYSSNGTTLTLDSSTLVSSTNLIKNEMGEGVEFVSGRGFVYNYQKNNVNWNMVNFSSFFGSTTSTVVNGSQFVGTARSGTDLELAEPPTELVGLANGSIAKGKPVILRTDGDFAEVGGTSSSGSTVSPETQQISGQQNTEDKFYIADNGNGIFAVVSITSNRARIILGEDTGTSITWGSEVTLDDTSENITGVSVYYDSVEDKFIATNVSGGSQNVCSYIVSYSGTTATKGTQSSLLALGFPNSNYVLASDYNTTDKKGIVCIGKDTGKLFTVTVSGTTITQSALSSQFSGSSNSAQFFNMVYDNTNSVGYITYRNEAISDYPYIQTFTVSGDTFSFGTETVIQSLAADGYVGVAEGSADGKGVCVAWRRSGTGINYIAPTFSGLVPTIGGVTTLSGGQVPDTSLYWEGAQVVNYNPVSKSFILAYQDTSGKYDIITNNGTVSGGTLTFSDYDVVYPTTNASQYYAISNPTGKNANNVFIIQQRYNQSPYKTAGSIWGASYNNTTTNLTSTNFIGFAQNTVADNEDVKVKVISQSDENQTSLTTASQYYVQTDGTLSTTAGTPSVLGGTALSSTKILIKS
jgi:hypothetical protein